MASFSWLFAPTPTTPTASSALPETVTSLFGKDIRFTGQLDLTAGKDYQVVTGDAALKQALYIRLLTAPGEFATRPDFGVGLSQFLKKRITGNDIDTIKQRIRTQIAADPRIEEILDLVIEAYSLGDKPGIRVYLKVKAAGNVVALPFDFKEL